MLETQVRYGFFRIKAFHASYSNQEPVSRSEWFAHGAASSFWMSDQVTLAGSDLL